MRIRIAGIRRGSQYSPNHIGNDAAVFNLTVQYLKEKGCDVIEYSEEEFCNNILDVDAVFNMARDWQSIKKLQAMENDGIPVINSAFGIENCTREKMTRLLVANAIPHPKSLILPTTGANINELDKLRTNQYWIKRGDFHAIHREDVTYVQGHEEARHILSEYAMRGIPTAVINTHLPGDLIKFYGVAGTEFFHWFYPGDAHHSKFGLEAINGASKGISFDEEQLKKICMKSGEVLNIRVYGGDCVVANDGTIRLIDFNDWPSFAPCRQEASPYIAEAIYEEIVKHLKKTHIQYAS